MRNQTRTFASALLALAAVGGFAARSEALTITFDEVATPVAIAAYLAPVGPGYTFTAPLANGLVRHENGLALGPPGANNGTEYLWANSTNGYGPTIVMNPTDPSYPEFQLVSFDAAESFKGLSPNWATWIKVEAKRSNGTIRTEYFSLDRVDDGPNGPGFPPASYPGETGVYPDFQTFGWTTALNSDLCNGINDFSCGPQSGNIVLPGPVITGITTTDTQIGGLATDFFKELRFTGIAQDASGLFFPLGTGTEWALDNVVLNPGGQVPEPASLMLVGTGLALAGRRLRRKK